MGTHSWFHGRGRHPEVIPDSADAIDDANDALYIDLE
jgi:hypothetical protein